METQKLRPGFSNLQLELLKLYANGVSDKQLIEIKSILGRYFAQKATEGIDRIVKAKGLTKDDIIEKSKEHHRSANRS
jgi:hypothetical protein